LSHKVNVYIASDESILRFFKMMMENNPLSTLFQIAIILMYLKSKYYFYKDRRGHEASKKKWNIFRVSESAGHVGLFVASVQAIGTETLLKPQKIGLGRAFGGLQARLARPCRSP